MSERTDRTGAGASLRARTDNYPVLVVPGFGAPAFQTELVSRHLRSTGLDTISVRLPWLAMGDMARSAVVVAEQARRVVEERGFEKVNLFGFSLGGLIARYYLQELEGYPLLGRGAFVSSPYSGTYLGYLGAFSPAGRQVRPASELLRRLEESAEREHVSGKCLSIFVRWDGVVVPCFSSYLPDGYNILMRRPLTHWRAVTSRELILHASEFLQGGMPECAIPGRELDLLEAGRAFAVPGALTRRRVWSVLNAPFRTFGNRVAALFRRPRRGGGRERR